MRTHKLGTTDITVSEICLGTMTWGTQNSEAEAHEQMTYAVDQGVNFFDTAELYPTTPLSKETQGRTEELIGTWLQASGKRDNVVLATKITGKGPKWIRGGDGINPEALRTALEGSLKRLQTDRIDLYQLHWPNRGSYHFRQNWTYDPSGQETTQTRDHIEATLETLAAFIAEGKIRAIGLSNESCWGTSQFLQIASEKGLPRVATIQNEYSLMCRLFDLDLAELSHNETVGLLAYTPLASGLLTGKYLDGAVPKGSRGDILNGLHGRMGDSAHAAVRAYKTVADRHGLDLAQMAIAFCLTRPFMTSVIIGATTMDQLKTDIAAKDVTLSDGVLDEIQSVYRMYPMPF